MGILVGVAHTAPHLWADLVLPPSFVAFSLSTVPFLSATDLVQRHFTLKRRASVSKTQSEVWCLSIGPSSRFLHTRTHYCALQPQSAPPAVGLNRYVRQVCRLSHFLPSHFPLLPPYLFLFFSPSLFPIVCPFQNGGILTVTPTYTHPQECCQEGAVACKAAFLVGFSPLVVVGLSQRATLTCSLLHWALYGHNPGNLKTPQQHTFALHANPVKTCIPNKQ